MNAESYRFVDWTGRVRKPPNLIPPVVIKKKDIDGEIQRLANLPAPANGGIRQLMASELTMSNTMSGLFRRGPYSSTATTRMSYR